MKLFYSISQVGDYLRGGVLAIGNFDGLHLGHMALINRVLALKAQRPGAILCFSPHPAALLNPRKPFFYLSDEQQKINLLEKLALDAVIIHQLDLSFLNLSPQAFIESVLLRQLAVKDIVVGSDFSFGAQASGTIADLTSYSEKAFFDLHVIEEQKINHERCSSSAIRDYLSLAKLKQAQAMLGRPFSVRGLVVKDQGQGEGLGFATANLKPAEGFCLKRGVYASVLRSSSRDYLSATNIGVRPTLTNSSQLMIETHSLDVVLDLTGSEIEVFFLEYLRDEIKFPSITALQEQVKQDLQQIRQKYPPATFSIKLLDA